MTKPVILTGIRANNDLTIGNYFGAILPTVDMAKTRSGEYDVNMFIPDLHSFTTPIDHSQLYDASLQNARVFAAAGLPLDNESIHVYRQSYIPAHSELTVILNNFVGFGEMSRMTQFKEKSGLQGTRSLLKKYLLDSVELTKEQVEYQKRLESSAATLQDRVDRLNQVIEFYQDSQKTTEEFINKIINDSEAETRTSVGLFDYPVLMAADILLYNAKYVPVGDDQSQHLEVTRDIAIRMNNQFGEVFTVPEAVKDQHAFFNKDQGLRIKDLVDPSKKMSKSDDTGRGVIFLSDTPEEAAKKIMSATTDDKASIHYDKENQPGISNLLDILALLRGMPVMEVAAEFEGQERYGDFKKIVSDEMAAFLRDFQARLADVDDTALLAKLERSETAMNDVANETLLRVQKAVGLRR